MKQTVVAMVLLALAGSAMAATPPASKPMPMEQRILVLERKVKALSELAFRLDALQREVQQLRGDVEVQNHTIEGMKQRQRSLYLDIDQRLNQMKPGQPSAMAPSSPSSHSTMSTPSAPPAMTTTNITQPPSGTAVATVDPAQEEARYQQAFDILKQRRYNDAKVALQQFLASYPGGRLADNAQYWLAETSYVTRDFDTALDEFNKVLNLYPQSAKVPDALLKAGFIHYEKKNWAEARSHLEKVVKRYSYLVRCPSGAATFGQDA